MQAEISCLVLQFVSEDITQFEERGGEWKRNYLAALSSSVDTVLPFLVKLLQVGQTRLRGVLWVEGCGGGVGWVGWKAQLPAGTPAGSTVSFCGYSATVPGQPAARAPNMFVWC
jgi:hypothetical protein